VIAALVTSSGQVDLVAEEGKALVILEEEEPQTTYPLLAKSMSEQRLGELLFDRFFVASLSGESDSKVFEGEWRARPPNLTMVMKESLKFSDGSSATFSDVAFTINDV